MSQVPPQFTAYPRENPNLGRQFPPGVHFDHIGIAWNLVKNKLGVWIAIILVIGILGLALQLPIIFLSNLIAYGDALAINTTPTLSGNLISIGLSSVLSLIPGTVNYILLSSASLAADEQYRTGELNFNSVFSKFRSFPSMLALVAILTGTSFLIQLVAASASFFMVERSDFSMPVVLMLLFLGLVVALGLGYVFSRIYFAFLLVLERQIGVLEAIRTSWRDTAPFGWGLLGYYIVLGLLSVAGAVCCYVGLLVTVPIMLAAIGLTYRAFYPLNPSPGNTFVPSEPIQRL